MDRAGSELDGARESLVKACPDAQVGHRRFPRSCLHQGLYWGGRCEGTRRLGEELGPVQPTPRSGGWEVSTSYWRQVDILVNIAGVKGEQDWETVYDVNLVNPVSMEIIFSQKGVHLGLETAWARMSKEKGGQGGRVISVSSTCGVTCQVLLIQAPM